MSDDVDPLRPARGILTGCLLSLALWALILAAGAWACGAAAR